MAGFAEEFGGPAVRHGKGMTLDRELWQDVTATVERGVAETFPAYTATPAWMRAVVMGVWDNVNPPVGGELEIRETGRRIGRCLAAPLQAFELEPTDLTGIDISNYIVAMGATILSLRSIRQKQMAALNAKYPGLSSEKRNDSDG